MATVAIDSTQSAPKDTRDDLHLLLALPNELLFLVTKYINCPRDLCALMLANRRLSILVAPLLHKFAVQDRDGRTALQWAAYRGHVGLAKLVLSKGFDVNDSPEVMGWPMSPFYYAVKAGRFELVKLLLDHGADIDATGEYGRTPLHAVVRSLVYLEEKGYREPDLTPDIPVFRRRMIEMPAVLLLLLERGANMELIDGGGYMAIHDAARFGSDATLSALTMLLDAGAPVDSRAIYGLTPLHCATDLGSLKAVELLLQRGADVMAKTALDFTPLHYSVFQSCKAISDVLTENGADWTAQDKYGRPPRTEGDMEMHVVCFCVDPCVRMLLTRLARTIAGYEG